MGCGCKSKSAVATKPKTRVRNANVNVSSQTPKKQKTAVIKSSKPIPKSTILNKESVKPIQKSLNVITKGTLTNCPLCGSYVKKISSPGSGEMIQCANPNCKFMRSRK